MYQFNPPRSDVIGIAVIPILQMSEPKQQRYTWSSWGLGFVICPVKCQCLRKTSYKHSSLFLGWIRCLPDMHFSFPLHSLQFSIIFSSDWSFPKWEVPCLMLWCGPQDLAHFLAPTKYLKNTVLPGQILPFKKWVYLLCLLYRIIQKMKWEFTAVRQLQGTTQIDMKPIMEIMECIVYA